MSKVLRSFGRNEVLTEQTMQREKRRFQIKIVQNRLLMHIGINGLLFTFLMKCKWKRRALVRAVKALNYIVNCKSYQENFIH